jgi:hypothetical protein
MMSGQVKVDGIDCTGRLMKPGKNVVFNKSAFSTSHTTIKPFLFGDLQLTGMYSCWAWSACHSWLTVVASRRWRFPGRLCLDRYWYNYIRNTEKEASWVSFQLRPTSNRTEGTRTGEEGYRPQGQVCLRHSQPWCHVFNEFAWVRLGEEVQRRFKKLARTELLDKDPVITFVFNYRPLGSSSLIIRHST